MDINVLSHCKKIGNLAEAIKHSNDDYSEVVFAVDHCHINNCINLYRILDIELWGTTRQAERPYVIGTSSGSYYALISLTQVRLPPATDQRDMFFEEEWIKGDRPHPEVADVFIGSDLFEALKLDQLTYFEYTFLSVLDEDYQDYVEGVDFIRFVTGVDVNLLWHNAYEKIKEVYRARR